MSLPKKIKIKNGRVIAVSCPKKSIVIKPTPMEIIRRMMIRSHYSHKVPRNSVISLGVYYKGSLTGGMLLGYGIRPKNSRGDAKDIMEFDRMWLSDDMPKYSESICLSLLHLYMQNAYPNISKLVSYADQSAGNDGIIYQAANYKEVGRVPVDFYLLPNGERVHPVAMWHRHRTRSKKFLEKKYPGYKHIKGDDVFQVKYEFDLHSKGIRRDVKNRPIDSKHNYMPTPPWCTHVICKYLSRTIDLSGKTCWEPAAGGGHMIDVLKQYFRKVKGCDIVNYNHRSDVKTADFLAKGSEFPEADWYITSPPLNRSLDFVVKMLESTRTGVAVLASFKWMENNRYYEQLFRDNPPSDILIFTEPISFNQGKPSSTVYAWYIWNNSFQRSMPGIRWIKPGLKTKYQKLDTGRPVKTKAKVKQLF